LEKWPFCGWNTSRDDKKTVRAGGNRRETVINCHELIIKRHETIRKRRELIISRHKTIRKRRDRIVSRCDMIVSSHIFRVCRDETGKFCRAKTSCTEPKTGCWSLNLGPCRFGPHIPADPRGSSGGTPVTVG